MGALKPLILAAFAAPAMPLAALYFPVFVYLAPFYAAERGVDLAWLGAALIIIRLLDAVTDPAMGAISDRFRMRWGRRKPWLAISTPLVVVSVWMAMVPPAEAGLAYAVIWLTALTLAWTVALTPYYAWGGEIATGYAGRARVTAWRESAALVGVIAAAVAYDQAGGGGAGLRAIAIMVAVLLPVAVLAAMIWAREPTDYSRRRIKLREALTAIAGNAPFRRLISAYLLNGAANALPATLFLFFVEQRLAAPEAAGPLLILYFVSAVLGAPFWVWAARRWEKHKTWSAAMLYACAVFVFAPFLGPGDVAGFAVICALTGLALGADLALPPSMQADVVDLDTAETGDQRTGVFFALWSVATKAALAITGGLALILLDRAGFEAVGDNSGRALFMLAALYAWAPVTLKLVAVAIMWRFPLGRAEHDRLRARIEGEG